MPQNSFKRCCRQIGSGFVCWRLCDFFPNVPNKASPSNAKCSEKGSVSFNKRDSKIESRIFLSNPAAHGLFSNVLDFFFAIDRYNRKTFFMMREQKLGTSAGDAFGRAVTLEDSPARLVLGASTKLNFKAMIIFYILFY